MNETNLTTTRISNIQPHFVLFFLKQGKGDCVLSKWEVDPSKNLVSVQSFADSSMIKGKT